jgi:UDP-2,4-diacetamido-2,4,6-trideoxy-beta-L-altropyranose hydrolase
MSRVVFRADAGAAIGAGHAMRCIALSRAFSAGGWSVGFACTEETFNTVKAFRALAVERLVVEGGVDEPAAIAARWPDIDVLVVDHYGRDIAFEAPCRRFCKRVVAIDDLADRAHDCDILVDSNAPSAVRYSGLVPAACQVLVGPAYAPLAPEFRAARPQALARRDGRPVERVLISFGQTDSDNATEFALHSLASAGFSGAVDVAIGSAAPCLASLRRYSEDHVNVRLCVDATNMPELMTAADFAIGAGGTTSWERCCLGLPGVMIEIAENQRGVMATVAEAKAGISLGLLATIEPEKILSKLQITLADNYGDQRADMARKGGNLVDGLGIERIVGAIEQ